MPPASTLTANEFLSPWTSGPVKDYSKNQNFSVGVNIITEWVADFSNATITLNQDNKPGDAQGGPFTALEASYDKTVWAWTVTYGGLDPTYNNVFYFSVARADGSDSFTGHYFNISNAVATTVTTTSSSAIAASSTTRLSTASPTTPATSASTVSQSISPVSLTASTTSQSTSPATVTAAAASNTGTPIGTIVGIVIGIIAGFLLLTGAAWWAWKFKKRRDAASKAQPLNVDSDQSHFDRHQDAHGVGKNQIYEMDERVEIQAAVQELGGGPVHELYHSGGVPSRPVHELYHSGGVPSRPVHELYHSGGLPSDWDGRVDGSGGTG